MMSVAELLQFEGWPEEMQTIARKAVREEIEAEDGSDPEAFQGAMDAQYALDQARYKIARQHLAAVLEKLKWAARRTATPDPLAIVGEVMDELNATLTAAVEMLEALPVLLCDVKEPT